MLFWEERVGKIISELGRYLIKNEIPLKDYEYAVVTEPIQDVRDIKSEWIKLEDTAKCGGEGKYYFYRTRVTIPNEMEGKTVVFRWNTHRGTRKDTTNPQGRLYVNGKYLQGLDDNHESVILTDHALQGTEYEICIRIYT